MTIDDESRTDLLEELVESELLLASIESQVRGNQLPHSELSVVVSAEKRCREYLLSLRRMLLEGSPTSDLRRVAHERVEFHSHTRRLLRLCGALRTTENWQSPVFLSSSSIPAGRHHPALSERGFEYSRDRHFDAENYERRFLDEFLGSRSGLAYAWLTSSGMAALVLGAHHIQARIPPGARVLARDDMYHEARELLAHWFPDRVDWLPADNSDIVTPLRTRPYAAVFLDAHTNATHLRCPDVPALLEYVVNQAQDAPYVLCDTSTLPFAAAEWIKAQPNLPAGKVFFAESLIKFHQFGQDATNGGMLVGFGRCHENDELWYLRAHLGVNIVDSCAATLPHPNRSTLLSRLRRMERNARLLAQSLGELLAESSGGLLGHVLSPALADYSDRSIVCGLPFRGALMSVELAASWHTPEQLFALSHALLESAQIHGLVLHAGSSFGFSTTRVYVTAATTRFGKPFLRIAPGSESASEVRALAAALHAGASQFRPTQLR